MILDEKPTKLVHTFLEEYINIFPNIDKKLALDYIKTQEKFDHLTRQWYLDLDIGLSEAYKVYNDDYYFTDLWTCFAKYSRTYLRNVRKYMHITDQKIIDLGCGIGYTTAALKQSFPRASVWGTNLRGTKQWDFCESIKRKYSFELVSEIDADVDIVFASEYFEHILDPITHLDDIVSVANPKYFIIANAFNTCSIGHFPTYYVKSEPVDQTKISRLFNKHLRSLGYDKEKMPFFNNKPNVWRKV